MVQGGLVCWALRAVALSSIGRWHHLAQDGAGLLQSACMPCLTYRWVMPAYLCISTRCTLMVHCGALWCCQRQYVALHYSSSADCDQVYY